MQKKITSTYGREIPGIRMYLDSESKIKNVKSLRELTREN